MFTFKRSPRVRRAVRRPQSLKAGMEVLEDRMVLSSWQVVTTPPALGSPQATVLLSNGRLLVNEFGTVHWFLVSPNAKGNYADPTIVPAHDSLYIHEYAGIALLNDGEVFISGAEYPQPGDADYNPATTGQNHIEIYNPATNSWRPVAPPSFFGTEVIVDNSVKVMPDGRVLAGTGGSGVMGLYNPSNDTWQQTGSFPTNWMNEVTLTMLPSGRVLGVATYPDGSQSWEYDETTGMWTAVGSTPVPLNTTEGGPMVGLPDGDVFALGAVAHWQAQTAIYSPTTQTWQMGPSVPDLSDGMPLTTTATTLDQVDNATYRLVPRLAPDLALEAPNASTDAQEATDVGVWNQSDAQIWDIVSDPNGLYGLRPINATATRLEAESAGSSAVAPVDTNFVNDGNPAQAWSVTLNKDGYFTLSPASAPGYALQVSQGGATTELDPLNGSPAQEWQLVQNANGSYGDEPLAALPNGHVLIAINQIAPDPTNSSQLADTSQFYEYNPGANGFSLVPSVPVALASYSTTNTLNMTVLPSGQVFVTGGADHHLYIYTPNGGSQETWKPAILGILPAPAGSSTHWVVGWGLNGWSEGGVYGDDNSTGSNYPLVQLVNRFGHVTYASTANWTTTQVGDQFEGVQFTTPASMPSGTYKLRVIASGVASNPVIYHYVRDFGGRKGGEKVSGTNLPELGARVEMIHRTTKPTRGAAGSDGNGSGPRGRS